MIRKITAAAFAALLVTAGAAAAAPGQAPSDSPADDHAHADESNEDAAANESAGHNETNGDAAANESADDNETAGTPAAAGSANDSDRGPPTDMPSQVPDHVVRIHETINEWLDGDKKGSLGAAISDILTGEESDSHGRQSGSDNASQTGTSTETPPAADADA